MLLYEGQEALTVLAEAPSNLTGVVFTTTTGTVAVTALFPELALTGNEIDAETCLRLVLAGTSPPLPGACSRGNLIELEVAAPDRFWFDSIDNRMVPIAVVRDADQLAVCSPAAVRCEINGG
jgi:hypothetical protein